jgi:hypothetical protein
MAGSGATPSPRQGGLEGRRPSSSGCQRRPAMDLFSSRDISRTSGQSSRK